MLNKMESFQEREREREREGEFFWLWLITLLFVSAFGIISRSFLCCDVTDSEKYLIARGYSGYV